MNICIVTGCGGLIGSEAVRFFSEEGFDVIGIDNDMRKYFFGPDATTLWCTQKLETEIKNFQLLKQDIRDMEAMENLFKLYNSDIKIIVHTAAQPSHDWAAGEPITDFTINANGTLILLELSRKYCPDTVFIFTSTNKVYGNAPNGFTVVELERRYELGTDSRYASEGFDETLSIDQRKHSLFGASKVAADIMVQEYGRYFGMKTACFRGGCLTGPYHSGTQQHGFLSFLMICAIKKEDYTVFGYKGKQVRDIIHSKDLVNMFWYFYNKPRMGEVYNVGGGRYSNCSMLEAISCCERITGNKIKWEYTDHHRCGDHIWWVSDVSKFKRHYPEWDYSYSLEEIFHDIFRGLKERI